MEIKHEEGSLTLSIHSRLIQSYFLDVRKESSTLQYWQTAEHIKDFKVLSYQSSLDLVMNP